MTPPSHSHMHHSHTELAFCSGLVCDDGDRQPREATEGLLVRRGCTAPPRPGQHYQATGFTPTAPAAHTASTRTHACACACAHAHAHMLQVRHADHAFTHGSEVRVGDKAVLSLLDMPRPFVKLKALEMEDVAKDVIKALA